MELTQVTVGIKGIKIFVRLLDSVKSGEALPSPENIYQIIKKEFNTDYSFRENAIRIKQALQPFCLDVKITPQMKGFSYYYDVISKK